MSCIIPTTVKYQNFDQMSLVVPYFSPLLLFGSNVTKPD
jgi:hypothetical protein